jgi:hypothetical protein
VTEVELGGHLDNPRLNPEHDTRVLTGPDDRVVGWGEVGPPGEPYVHAEGWMLRRPRCLRGPSNLGSPARLDGRGSPRGNGRGEEQPANLPHAELIG